MLRFLKLDPHHGREIDYIDLENIVYVRETNASLEKDEKGLSVAIFFVGGVTTRLTGAAAVEFLKQFEAYIARRAFQHTATPSGPGLSALSP